MNVPPDKKGLSKEEIEFARSIAVDVLKRMRGYIFSINFTGIKHEDDLILIEGNFFESLLGPERRFEVRIDRYGRVHEVLIK